MNASSSYPPLWTPLQKWLLALLIGTIGVAFFFCLGSCRTLDAHEGYLAVTARAMLDSGDWLVPRFGGVLRLEKPPWGYWVVAVVGWLRGGIDEWATRLPSALAAVGMVVLIGVWVSRWHGRTAGLCAALIQTTSVWQIYYGRLGIVDMQMCLFMTLALFLVAHAPAEESGRRFWLRWLGFWALLGLSWLAKLIYGPALVLGVVGVYWLVQRQWRLLFHPVHWVGLGLFALIALPWSLYLLWAVPEALEVWRYEIFGRVAGEIDSRPWWYLLGNLGRLGLPYSLFAAWVMWKKLRAREWKTDERFVFVLCWFGVQFLLMHVSKSKHSNYLLPCMPVLPLLVGPLAAAWIERSTQPGRWRLRPNWVVVSNICVGVLSAALLSRPLTRVFSQTPMAAAALATLCGAGVIAILSCYWLKGPRQAFSAWILLVAGVLSLFAGWLEPGRDPRRPMAEFARQSRHHAPAEEPLFVYGVGKHLSLFYVPGPWSREDDVWELAKHMSRKGVVHVYTSRQFLPSLYLVGNPEPLARIDVSASPRTDPLLLIRFTAPLPSEGN